MTFVCAASFFSSYHWFFAGGDPIIAQAIPFLFSPRTKANPKPPTLQITIAQTSTDWELAHQLLDEEHFLGAGREAGDPLRQFILEDGHVVAVLI